MSHQVPISFKEIKNKIILAFFFVIFSAVRLLIFIGELTQKILIYPFLYSYRFFQYIIRKGFDYSNSVKSQTLPVEKTAPIVEDEEDDIELDVLGDLEIEVADESRNTFFAEFCIFIQKPLYKMLPSPPKRPWFSFLTVFTSSLQSKAQALAKVFTHSTKVVASQSYMSLEKKMVNFPSGVKRIPLGIYFILNEVGYYLYTLFEGIVHGIRGIYRFFTSSSFRYFLYGFGVCIVAVVIYQGYLFISDLPSPRSIGKLNFAQSTHLYDRNGKSLYEIYRDVNRTSINLNDLPPYIVQATISIEDKNYYSHKGISFFGGILRAAKDTLRTNELQGGSTITQQLVKSALLSPERTVERKTKEIILALWTEQIYTKNQIMEMYLNQVPYGGSSYGIEEASQVYFGKQAKDLTLEQAALLAGLPRAPSIYSPFVDPELALRRRNDVLAKMYELGYIKKDRFEKALATNIDVLSPKTDIKAPHFVFYARNELEKEFGTRQVEEGGFRVTTSLDLDIQTKAEQILKEELEKINTLNVTNGGIVVLDPQTGEILAMVGSVDYFADTDGAFNVTTALRQPGSTLKPMLYAMAMERGYTAASPIDDSPIIFQSPGGEAYRPVNYDGRFHGRVTLRQALSNSYNIPAVKVLNTMGVQPFVSYAKQMGIDSWEDSSRFGLSLSLGGGEVSLVDLAQVYTVLASGGYRVEPSPFVKVVDDKERVILDHPTSKVKVIDEGIAYIISDILADNVARQQAFGPGSALEIKGQKVSVKTGTSNDKKDNLTVGYTPEFLVAVWVGNNDNTPMNQQLTSGITGAAPIWNRVMTYLLETKSEGIEFEKPSNVIARPCYGSNRVEYFLVGTDTGFCHDAVIRPKIQTQNAPQNKPLP